MCRKSSKAFMLLALMALLAIFIPPSVSVSASGEPSVAASRIVKVNPGNPDVGEPTLLELQFRDRSGNPMDEWAEENDLTFYLKSPLLLQENIYITTDKDIDFDETDFADKVGKTFPGFTVNSDRYEEIFEITIPAGEGLERGRVYMWFTSFFPGEIELNAGLELNDQLNDATDIRRHIADSPVSVYFGDPIVGSIDLSLSGNQAGSATALEAVVYKWEDKRGPKLKDKEVIFYERYADRRWTEIGTADSDMDGVAELEITREQAREYEYKAVAGDEESEIQDRKIHAASPADISAYADSIRAEVGKTATVSFLLQDKYGNNLDAEGVEALDSRLGKYNELEDKFTIDDDFRFGMNYFQATVTDPDGNKEDIEEYYVAGDNFVAAFEPERLGTYKVEASIRGLTDSAKTVVNVGRFSEAVSIAIDSTQDMLRERGDVSINDIKTVIDGDPDRDFRPLERLRFSAYYTKLETKLIDQKGIARTTDPATVQYRTNNQSLASLYTAEDGEDEGEVFLISSSSDGGIVTVTARHRATGLESSKDINLGGKPASLQVDIHKEKLGATVTMNMLDRRGNFTPLIEGEGQGYRISAPAAVDSFDHKDFTLGKSNASFKLEAEEENSHIIRVTTDLGLSKTFEVFFTEEPAVYDQPRYGAANTTMVIGSKDFAKDGEIKSMDVAPFIEDSRTFVPVRFLANAFGVENEQISWGPEDEATEWVNLARQDITVEIIIGDKALLVTDTQTGEELRTIKMDVSAGIWNNRTFLPFRFIAEAFGAEVDYETDAHGYVEYVQFQQK